MAKHAPSRAHGTRATGIFANPSDLRAERRKVEALVERLIAYLDAIDGDPDLEDDSEDRCLAFDDSGGASVHAASLREQGPGDCEDEEFDGIPLWLNQSLPQRLSA